MVIRTYKRLLINPQGQEIVVENLAKFCRENNLNDSHLNQVARGERNHCKKWKCRYFNDSYETWTAKQKCKKKAGGGWTGQWEVVFANNNKIIMNTLTEFCREYKYNYSNLTELKRGKIKKYRDIVAINKVPNSDKW